MKTKSLLLIIVIIILNTSCAGTKVSHSQYMDNEVINQTKYGILSKYGNPTQVRVAGDYEEWIYNLGQFKSDKERNKSITSSSSGQSGVSAYYDKYIMITFLNGRAIKWETQGVDYTAKGGNSTGVILAILYIAILAATLSLLFSGSGY